MLFSLLYHLTTQSSALQQTHRATLISSLSSSCLTPLIWKPTQSLCQKGLQRLIEVVLIHLIQQPKKGEAPLLYFNAFLPIIKNTSRWPWEAFPARNLEAADSVSLNKVEVSNRNVIAVRGALAQNRRRPLSFPVLQRFVGDVKMKTPSAAPRGCSSARDPVSWKGNTEGIYSTERGWAAGRACWLCSPLPQ